MPTGDDSSDAMEYDDTIEFDALEYGRPTVIKQLNINIPDARGHVVIGGTQASIAGVPASQGREDAPFDQANTRTTQTAGVGSSASKKNEQTEKQESQNSNDRSSQANLFYARNTPGCYCHHNYYQQTSVGDWSPKQINGIVIQRGDIEFQWSAESFLENPEQFIRGMDTCAGSLKEEKQQFILLGILPFLEKAGWSKSSASNIETYKVLAQVSCSRNCRDVAKHSLQQLLHLLYRDDLDNCQQNLLSVEKIIRLSIVSPDGAFREEADQIRVLRLSVYGRILAELIIHQLQAGFSEIDLENNLKKLEELKNYFSQISVKKKDFLRHSVEFIQGAISYLLPRSPSKTLTTRLERYLEECKAFCSANKQIAEKDFSLFQKSKTSKVKSFDLQCILYYLHGKVHTERPKPQMHKERRAMILLRRVVEAYLDGGGGDDWRFCLLAASLLSEISMNNVTRELRIEAGGCLVSLLKNQKARKSPECRTIVERLSKRVLFCQDSPIKKLLLPHLYGNQNALYTLPAELHIDHLANCYKTQTLEINSPIVSELSCDEPSYFVYDGTLKGQKVAVKILGVSKQDILEENSTEDSESKKRLVAEAYSLWQLNSLNRHPNIPVLLACNTQTLPYHIITEYEKHGNLLQFVRASREVQGVPSTVLYKILISIIEGLLYLHQKLYLVHCVVMAENILVGDGYTCKLSGLHSLGMLQYGQDAQDSHSPGYDYALDDLPVCIKENDENLPVRWKAQECLRRHSYSTASDVWAFGVLMYEVLTLGCRPYKNIREDVEVANYVFLKEDEEVLPQESSITDDEYALMKQCLKRQRNERINFFQLQEELKKMRSKLKPGEETPRPNPPPLDLVGMSNGNGSLRSHESNESLYESYEIAGYDNIPEYTDVVDRSQTIHEGYENMETIQEQRDDTLSMPTDLPTNVQLGQDVNVIRERIAGGDKQHLRRLLSLNNDNLLPIWRIDNLDSRSPVVDMLSPRTDFGNLKEYVLSRRCQKDDIITFLCQVAAGLHYLHVNHIVHGDLRAEHVHVVEARKVQVGRLGRSKPLYMSAYEVTSTSCVVDAAMPSDSTRWSAPEVILANRYSHASDVWSFGILAWELYTAFAVGQTDRATSLPYYNIKPDKSSLSNHMREAGPLSRPDGCPDWVYIMMHQCWTYDATQRPPFIAILDCLSSREPMQSWMMKLWLNDHDRSEWPERPIYQPEDACHVTRAEEHPSKEVIEAMCSEGFFTHHKYQYVENIRGSESDEVDNEQYEYYELPDQSPLDLPPQSPQEGLSTGSVSPDHSSKFVEGDVTDRTCNAERQLQETTNYSNQMTSSHEQKAEQDSFFTETSNSINFYQAEEEPYEYCYDYCRGDDDDDEEEEEEEQEEEGEEEEEEEEEEEDKEEPYSSANANEKSREDARRVEVGKNGFKSNISLDNDTAYTELDTSSKGYMPLAKEQWKAQEPCCINLENEVFKTKVAQCSSNNSADESYMCVDLLVQGLHQGQEDERPLTEPVNSDQNYHSHEDMAIQALLKSAECLYHDIVQKMKKSTESRV